MDGGGGLLQQSVKGGLVNMEGALELEKHHFPTILVKVPWWLKR